MTIPDNEDLAQQIFASTTLFLYLQKFESLAKRDDNNRIEIEVLREFAHN